jgi:hypothetical protein
MTPVKLVLGMLCGDLFVCCIIPLILYTVNPITTLPNVVRMARRIVVPTDKCYSYCAAYL